MKDLYRCLDEYPEDLLLAIADAWGIALPRDESMRMVKRLADAMLSPGALTAAVASLSPAAQGALAFLAAQGGAALAGPTALRYGAVRRFGPARLRREKPWLAPSSPLEELYFYGLVYRAYGQVGEHLGDLFLIPDDLAALLSPLETATAAGDTIRLAEPSAVAAQGEALLEDMLAIIVLLRGHPLTSSAQGPPTPAELAQVAQSARLLGDAEPARLEFLWRALLLQKLVEHDGRQWRPTLNARHWLRQTDAAQWLATFLAWRDDEDREELFHLPTIVCEREGWQNKPSQARRRLCAILATYSAGVWYDLASLLGALRAHHPDYLRPDGDLDSWLIRDAETGAYLRGMESWDKIEGALARHLLTGPLHWMGLLDLGREGASSPPAAVRLTPGGKALMAGLPADAPSLSQPGPKAEIDERMAIRISTRNSRYQRYQLERLAVFQAQNESEARYLLTDLSVWQGLNAGIQGEQILAFLRRITAGALPEPVERVLAAWAGRFGRVTLRRAVILETADEAAMRVIRLDPDLAPLLGEALSPTLCLASEERLEELVAKLKERELWPRIKR